MLSFERLIEHIERQNKALKNRVNRIISNHNFEVALALKNRKYNNRYAVIHPCTDGRNNWQVTMFDQYGPYSDCRRDTVEKVVTIAIEEGYRIKVEDIHYGMV